MMGPRLFGGCCGGFGGFGWIGMLFNFLVIAAVIWLVVWAVRRFTVSGGMPRPMTGGASSPREILQMRYARGEITREQYEEMLNDLNLQP